MIIADSDVLIEYLRGRDPMAGRVELELKSRSFATTTVNAFELWSGAHTARQAKAVETLLAAMTILALDEDGARRGGDIRRTLVAQGHDIGMADCLIAGVCLTHGGTLLTNNRKHFERVDGLRLSTGSK